MSSVSSAHIVQHRVHVRSVSGRGITHTIRMNLPKGAPLGFGEICVDFWDFERGAPEPLFLLLLVYSLFQLQILITVGGTWV